MLQLFLNQKGWFSSSVSAQFKVAWENEGGLVVPNSTNPELSYFFSFIVSERESKRLLSNGKILFSPNWITDSIRSGFRRDPSDYILLEHKSETPRPLPPDYVPRSLAIDPPSFSQRKASLTKKRQGEFGWSGYGNLNSGDGRLSLFDVSDVEEEEPTNEEENEMEAVKSERKKSKRKLPKDFESIRKKKSRLSMVSKGDGEEFFEHINNDDADEKPSFLTSSKQKNLSPTLQKPNLFTPKRIIHHEAVPTTTMTVKHFLDSVVYPNQPNIEPSKDEDILKWVMDELEDFEPGVDGYTVELSGMSR